MILWGILWEAAFCGAQVAGSAMNTAGGGGAAAVYTYKTGCRYCRDHLWQTHNKYAYIL